MVLRLKSFKVVIKTIAEPEDILYCCSFGFVNLNFMNFLYFKKPIFSLVAFL